MSLRPCPDCGRDVSADAPACPHCGRPINPPKNQVGFCGGCVAIVLVCLLFVTLCSYGAVETAREAFMPDTTGRGAAPIRYITGCEDGVPERLDRVNLFAEPGLRVIGSLRATSATDPCRGEAVRILETRNLNGRTFFHVESITGSRRGWVSDMMIGNAVDPAPNN
jgi:hypothetical protein